MPEIYVLPLILFFSYFASYLLSKPEQVLIQPCLPIPIGAALVQTTDSNHEHQNQRGRLPFYPSQFQAQRRTQ